MFKMMDWGTVEDKIKEIISSSPISDEIKRTIQIEHSVVEGSINI